MRHILAIALMTTAAQAAPCLPTLDDFATALQRQWGETAQIIGTMPGSPQARAFVMFANPATGSWTVVVQAPDGRYCSPASGTDYHAAPQGEPA